jgi:hypothetical protein
LARRFTGRIFASLFKALILLPDSIKVVRQILVLFVEVRILVGQQVPSAKPEAFLFGSVESLLS